MPSYSVTWDAAPVRQSFGRCNVVFDGVATWAGSTYRVNVTATTGGRKPELILRHMTAAKRGHAVAESMLPVLREFITAEAIRYLEPYRAAYVAEAQARDTAPTVEAEPAPVEFVEIMPQTWESSLGMLLAILEAGDVKGRTMARTELIRMAKVADLAGDARAKLDSIRDAGAACDSGIKALASTRGMNSVQAIDCRDAFRTAVRAVVGGAA